jgi:hypothetical protein
MTEGTELKEWGPDTWYEPADDPIILPGTFKRSSLVQANPLFYDGLLYTISTGGVLRVEESGMNKHIYSRLVGLNQVKGGLSPSTAGLCASPTQAGDYVYLFGADGATLLIKAGRIYEEVAKNRIERMLPPPRISWGQRRSAEQMVSDRRSEVTISSPIFDGKRLYYRAERYLYCIGTRE